MKYKPGQDQRDVYMDTEESKGRGGEVESQGSAKKPQGRRSQYQPNNNTETNSYQQFECNMVIWGKWKHIYDQPIQLNIEVAELEGGLKSCIVDMISKQDYCLFLTEEGKLYSMGQSDLGILGLGRGINSTSNQARQILFPDNQKVLSIKVGKSHALALTQDGKVYGWGQNNYGQVGYLTHEELTSMMAGEQRSQRSQLIYEPQQVYPTVEMDQANNNLVNLFDFAKQIDVYEDSSFLVTEDGFLFSWGKNENGMLGREAKLDVKMIAASQDKRRKLTFSTFVPGRVTKLEKFNVKRVSIQDGKVMAYFAESNEEFEDEQVKDSEVDSEEEKDVVADIGGDRKQPTSKLSHNNVHGSMATSSQQDSSQGKGGDSGRNRRRSSQMADNFSSTNELRKQNTNRSNMSTNSSRLHSTSKGGGRKARQDKDQFRYLSEIIKRAIAIKDELNKFDRALADSVKPLTDLQDRNIYYQVIDKFSLGQEKMNDAEDLRQAIDRMQVQLKKNVNVLDKLEKRINESLAELIQARVSMFRGDDELFKDTQILVELLNESLAMKKFNLVGCKMKVYQERMKEINFLEMVQLFRENDQIDIDKCGSHLHTCKKLCKKIQQSLKKNTEFYLQMHMNCSVPSSLALSALTNSVFQQCDIWNGLNTLSSYTYILQSKIQDAEYTNDKVKVLWQHFQTLQKTNFNKKVEQYAKKQKEFPSTKDWFEAMMKEINYEVKHVMSAVKYSMKESKGENDVLLYCQALLFDACQVRQMLYQAQQALFEGSNNIGDQDRQMTEGGGFTEGNNTAQMRSKELQQLQQTRDYMTGSERASMVSLRQSEAVTQGNTIGEKIGGIFSYFSKK